MATANPEELNAGILADHPIGKHRSVFREGYSGHFVTVYDLLKKIYPHCADWELELLYMGANHDHKLRTNFAMCDGVRLFSNYGDLYCIGDSRFSVASVGRNLEVGPTFGIEE